MEISELVENMPTFVKYYCGAALTMAAMATWGMLPQKAVLVCLPEHWTNLAGYVFSPLFHGKFNFNILFEIYFIILFVGKLEKSYSTSHSYADFIYLLIITYLACLVICSLLNWGSCFLLSLPIKEALIYVTCKRNPEEVIMFMFILKVKSKYFPFASAAFNLLSGQSIINEIVGIGVGHVFVYLKDILPTQPG